jgi:hypothetical protein
VYENKGAILACERENVQGGYEKKGLARHPDGISNLKLQISERKHTAAHSCGGMPWLRAVALMACRVGASPVARGYYLMRRISKEVDKAFQI